MYVIKRNKSFWLCQTAREVFELENIKLRLQGELKDFAVFEQRLDDFEILNVGVIKVYKCSNTSSKCKDCTKYTGCEIRLKVLETAKAYAEWAKWVENNGGYTF